MRTISIGIAVFLGVGGPACGNKDPFVGDKTKIAKLVVDSFALNDIPRWMMGHVNKACPDSLLDVAQFVGKAKPDTLDPWGTPYELFCGKENLPPGATGSFAVMSYGPDKKMGTEDDIKSWEKRPE